MRISVELSRQQGRYVQRILHTLTLARTILVLTRIRTFLLFSAFCTALATMVGVYDALWRSLTLYLEDLSPGQHVAVMMATVATTVAVLVGGCWTYRHRSISTYNGADSTVNLQADGKCTGLFFVEWPLHPALIISVHCSSSSSHILPFTITTRRMY